MSSENVDDSLIVPTAPPQDPKPFDRLERCPIAPSVPLREVRLAVSMVGGTSLAIYENGVTQELLRLVQGRGVYGLLKRLTRSHAYIDILSGTSAGGINNIFLATALANGADTWNTRDTWINEAGIDVLLPDPGDRSVRAILKGNTHYREALVKAFEGILGGGPGNRRADEFPLRSGYRDFNDGNGGTVQRYGEIDLFVTGTYIEGMPSVFFDTRNQPIFNENHNGVFRLKHRPGRRESHFNPNLSFPVTRRGAQHTSDNQSPGTNQGIEDLVKRLTTVARTTSSLPAIFEPSMVRHDLMDGIIPLPTVRQKNPGEDGPISYFGDGGYLNNRPLGLVLGKIRSRPSGPEVLRKVLFVEPVAEKEHQSAALQKEPTALQHLVFYVSVQGKQSLRDQLESILDHNHRVRRVRTALKCARIEAKARNGAHPVGGAVDPSQMLWAEVRLQDLWDQIVASWEAYISRGEKLDQKLTPQDQMDLMLAQARRLRCIRGHLLTRLKAECVDLHPGTGSFSLDQFDADFLGRRILRLKDDIRDTVYPRRDDTDSVEWDEQQRRQEVLRALAGSDLAHLSGASDWLTQNLEALSKLHTLVELVQVLLRDVVDAVAASPDFELAVLSKSVTSETAKSESDAEKAAESLWQLLARAVSDLLSPLTASQTQSSDAFSQALMNRSAKICRSVREDGSKYVWTGTPGDTRTVLDVIDEQAGMAAQELVPRLAPICDLHYDFAFEWAYDEQRRPLTWQEMRDFLDRLDRHLYPVERAADLPCLSTIELVHVSARDVQVGLSRQNAEDKLAGDVLMNLGGFFKRSWRVNDVLWGRLDASGAVVEMLLDPSRLARVMHEARERETWPELMAAIRSYLETGLSTHTAADRPSPGTPKPDSIGEYLGNYPRGEHEESLDEILDYAETWFEKGGTADTERVASHLSVWLLRRHQLEILLEEVPDAVAADLAEHGEWQGGGLADHFEAPPPRTGAPRDKLFAKELKARRKRTRKAADALATLSGGDLGTSTQLTLQMVALKWAKRNFAAEDANRTEVAPPLDAKAVHDYFRWQYRTGVEAIADDIPALVTVRRVAAALAVTFNVLQTSLGESSSSKLAGGTLTRLTTPVYWCLWSAYQFIDTITRGKGVAVACHTVLWTVIFAGLLLRFAPIPGAAATHPVILPVAVGAAILEILYWCWRRGPMRTIGWTLMVLGMFQLGLKAGDWLATAMPRDPVGKTELAGRASDWGWGVLMVSGLMVYGTAELVRRGLRKKARASYR